MFCSSCGAQVADDATRCPKCGGSLPAPFEKEVEAAVRDAAHEIKRVTKHVVREAKPLATKVVAVTRGAVRGAIKGVKEVTESTPAAPPPPPPPPPPGATGDARPRKPGDPQSPASP